MTDKNTAGRPRLSNEEPTVGVHATVPKSLKDFLKEYGRGNISRGLRWLVEEKMEGKEEAMDCDKEAVFEFLDKLEVGSATNTFVIASQIMGKFGLDRMTADALLGEWASTFSEGHPE